MDDSSQHHAWVNHENARYYQAHLDRDLFGDWTLRKVWGGIGSSRGRMHSTAVASYDDGIAQVREIAKRRAQRGYRSIPARCSRTG
jgi:cytochrome b